MYRIDVEKPAETFFARKRNQEHHGCKRIHILFTGSKQATYGRHARLAALGGRSAKICAGLLTLSGWRDSCAGLVSLQAISIVGIQIFQFVEGSMREITLAKLVEVEA
jgi:hypothetical protein